MKSLKLKVKVLGILHLKNKITISMNNVNRIGERILSSVRTSMRENVGKKFEEMSDDDLNTLINQKSKKEILRIWLEWEGIIGYTDSILHILNL